MDESVKERYFPEEAPEGILMFTFDSENDLKTFSYHLNNTFVFITKNYTNTIKALKKYGLYDLLKQSTVKI